MVNKTAAGRTVNPRPSTPISTVSGRAALHKDDDVGNDPDRGDRCQDDRNDKIGFGVAALFFALHGLGRS